MKKILISGSSSGIGRAISELLLASGYVVIGMARDHQKFDPQNENYHPWAIDFSELSTLEEQIKELIQMPAKRELLVSAFFFFFIVLMWEKNIAPQVKVLLNQVKFSMMDAILAVAQRVEKCFAQ